MKENILKLRAEGKTYKEIKQLLNCSKSTISYHCGEGQKEKFRARQRKTRSNKILRKLELFHSKIRARVVGFQRRDKDKKVVKSILGPMHFTWRDVLDKLGPNPCCYLTGKPIDLADSKSYNFDHIIPVTKGGSNSLENLGLLTTAANNLKDNLTVDELLEACVDILKYNGYRVSKIKKHIPLYPIQNLSPAAILPE